MKIELTLSFGPDSAEIDISRGADRIWPEGDKFLGMCSIVMYRTNTLCESWITSWPWLPSKAQQLPGVLSAVIARCGELRLDLEIGLKIGLKKNTTL